MAKLRGNSRPEIDDPVTEGLRSKDVPSYSTCYGLKTSVVDGERSRVSGLDRVLVAGDGEGSLGVKGMLYGGWYVEGARGPRSPQIPRRNQRTFCGTVF